VPPTRIDLEVTDSRIREGFDLNHRDKDQFNSSVFECLPRAPGTAKQKRLQEAAVPPANYVHPEFGYLCPTSRLRRDFRVAVVAIVLGGIIGAMVVTLRADHDRDAETERIRTP
jgi:hypothetical protein